MCLITRSWQTSPLPALTPVNIPCVHPETLLSLRASRSPHSAPSGSLGSSKLPESHGWSRPAFGAPPGAAAHHGWGVAGWGGLFVVLSVLMSQARQGHRKEESDYSKDGQCSRQPERTLPPPAIVARERQPARRSARRGRTLGARSSPRRGRFRRDCSMKRLCSACQPWVRADAEDAAVGFQLSD